MWVRQFTNDNSKFERCQHFLIQHKLFEEEFFNFLLLLLFFQGILKRKLDIIGTQISKNIKTIQKFQVSPISKIYF
jgi:hypothetical protein